MTAKLAMTGIAAMALASLAIPPQPRAGALVWNFSPSIAVGLYRIAGSQWGLGDYVAVIPSPRLSRILTDARVLKPARLLLKRVAGAKGDVVCRAGSIVSVNGKPAATARETAPTGEALPAWSGCAVLGAGEVFLLGDTDASFDGRYFGVTDARSVVGRLAAILLLG